MGSFVWEKVILEYPVPSNHLQIQIHMEERWGKYPLEERVVRFAKLVLTYVRTRGGYEIKTLVPQLVRSATSVAANYMEACIAESRKDFRHKCCLSAKEAKESWFWLRMIVRENDAAGEALIQEAMELTKIFSAIKRTCDQHEHH